MIKIKRNDNANIKILRDLSIGDVFTIKNNPSVYVKITDTIRYDTIYVNLSENRTAIFPDKDTQVYIVESAILNIDI